MEYENKLMLLVANSDLLLRREKEPILRMKGQTQSYFMYDSYMFKEVFKMKKRQLRESKKESQMSQSNMSINPLMI
jgi:hypothetical protein